MHYAQSYTFKTELSTFRATAELHLMVFSEKDANCAPVVLVSMGYVYRLTRALKQFNIVLNVITERIQIIALVVLVTDTIIHSQIHVKKTGVFATTVLWENVL